MPRDFSLFTARFRQLTDSMTRWSAATAIGCTTSYVTGLRKGRHRPSRRMLIRIVEAFGLELAEWSELAGYDDEPIPAPALPRQGRREERPANGFGDGARDYFIDHIQLMERLFGGDLIVRPSEFPAPHETRAQVDERLLKIGQRALEVRDRKKGHKSGRASSGNPGNPGIRPALLRTA